jgi:hypothetical protein
MAKIKKNGKPTPPKFRIGDMVSFPRGDGRVTGKIVEDRGGLGIGGRRLYGIKFEFYPGEERYTEVPEVDLTAETAVR